MVSDDTERAHELTDRIVSLTRLADLAPLTWIYRVTATAGETGLTPPPR